MEVVGAKRIWERSIEKNKLRYTTFYGNGDSKGYLGVCNVYPGIKVEKTRGSRPKESWVQAS